MTCLHCQSIPLSNPSLKYKIYKMIVYWTCTTSESLGYNGRDQDPQTLLKMQRIITDHTCSERCSITYKVSTLINFEGYGLKESLT